jgi:hypothetical protein
MHKLQVNVSQKLAEMISFVPLRCLFQSLYLPFPQPHTPFQWYSTGLRAGWSGVWVPAGLGIFLFTTSSWQALGLSQPPIQWLPGALSLGVKRSVREADHSPPSSAEVEECVELYLHSPIRLYGMVLSKKSQELSYAVSSSPPPPPPPPPSSSSSSYSPIRALVSSVVEVF